MEKFLDVVAWCVLGCFLTALLAGFAALMWAILLASPLSGIWTMTVIGGLGAIIFLRGWPNDML